MYLYIYIYISIFKNQIIQGKYTFSQKISKLHILNVLELSKNIILKDDKLSKVANRDHDIFVSFLVSNYHFSTFWQMNL